MKFILNNPYLLGFSILTIVNLLILIWLFLKFTTFRKTQKQLMSGEGEGANLEEIVLKQKKQISTLTKNLKELGKLLEEIVENNKINMQKAGVVRFNPFADTGGNMSFTIALLDGRDNGILISSLHSREGTRIYAKALENGQGHNLTDEEKEAIVKAKGS